MSTFFQQTAQAMIAKHIDRFPLLKLDQVIDWQPIEQYLNRQRTRYLRDHRGRPAYPLLSMFKAILLGQWHSLSDPELEHSLITRIDFNLFCRFDELSIPDYSTLCRYRNWLAQDDTLSELLELINRQLTEKNLKVEKASTAVIDATIIQTAGSKQRQAIEVDEEGQVSGQTTPSKDSDARWTKKNGLYKLGYKQHTRTDEEGWLEHEVTRLAVCEYLKPLLADGIDTLVLGCTHFPLLKPLIGREAGNVALVDSAITTAEETARVLAQEGLLNTDNNNPDYRFYVSDIPLKFRTIGERFLGRTMEQIEMVSLG
ncbi:transposase [Neisseria mucosa]|uniref:transposase n=1 Tax=Neisseria mucosa TaxID=488 RepID=UPI00163DA360|nr:transposase [Neisseria mucosa]